MPNAVGEFVMKRTNDPKTRERVRVRVREREREREREADILHLIQKEKETVCMSPLVQFLLQVNNGRIPCAAVHAHIMITPRTLDHGCDGA